MIPQVGGMSERAMQKAVTMAHRARRQAAGLQFAVELGGLRRPQLLDHNSAEVRLDLISVRIWR